MTLYETLSVLGLFGTLGVIGYYTFHTKRIADFTARQADAIPGPFVMLETRRADPMDTVLESESERLSSSLAVENIGTASAINVRLTVELGDSTTKEWKAFHLRPQESRLIHVPEYQLADPSTLAISWESIGGLRSTLKASIENRKWVRNVRVERAVPKQAKA